MPHDKNCRPNSIVFLGGYICAFPAKSRNLNFSRDIQPNIYLVLQMQILKLWNGYAFIWKQAKYRQGGAWH